MNKYTIETEIKRGAFGAIYKGIVKKSREQVAIKIDHSEMPTLQHEVRMIQYLYMAKVRNIPSIYWFGLYEEKPSLIMTYYECSLFDYSKTKRIDNAKADMILLKVLDIFENIHKLFVLHRDIKPQNFMIKDGDIYLIDFGLSMFYINENGEHYPDKISDTMIGSANFASIHVHNGNRYSRRDDLIALGYLYLFMIGSPFVSTNETSDLPIINILHPMNQLLKKQKEMDHLRTLLSNKTIEYYMKYVYSLEYDETPKYEPLKFMFIKKA
jgi:casein kinase 1